MYIQMMGAPGIRAATEVAILNANYDTARLKRYFPVLYTGAAAWRTSASSTCAS